VARPTVYVETSIISYLVGWLNRDSIMVAANQELTREWWTKHRGSFELLASVVVVDEASKGDDKLAAERLALLSEVELLDVTADARQLATDLVRESGIPAKAELDALHIAVAATNGMDYLLTWNCTHIANAFILPRVYGICRRSGYEPPFCCTPQELMEG
jgi:PIN domain